MAAGPVEQLRDMLIASSRAAVFTGAGISTRSGIPDFRSPTTGIWEYVDPMAVASIWAFREEPGRFYRWLRPLARKMFEAAPNPAHNALALLEKANRVSEIITQNIDSKGGSDESGVAKLFTRDATGQWKQTATLRPPTPYDHGAFGSAVSLDGVRFGKGHGFFDLEWGMFTELGIVDDSTPVAAVVHEVPKGFAVCVLVLSRCELGHGIEKVGFGLGL